MAFAFTMLITALILSMVAAYYSIVGLTAIFSAAIIPIVIMGASLELGKVMTTVWLHNNWQRASWRFKSYLIPAVLFLMLLTSMGIFGFLSKAHNDQNLVSGDVQSKIAIYDEKIKTEKENIEADRKALKQMDEGVDQVLGRSADEKGADKAVALRKSQQKERARLQAEILQSQKSIAELNDARAPIAAEVRKVEAEVGPIKYIAALIYGDNPDANVLERAVRWVIILIVVVFDPLALCLILASQQSMRWAREDRLAKEQEDIFEDGYKTPMPAYEPDDGPLTDEQIAEINEIVKQDLPIGEVTVKDELFPTKEFDITDHPYLFTPVDRRTPPGIDPVPPQVYRPEVVVLQASDVELDPCYKCGTPLIDAPGIGPFCPNKECDVVDNTLGVEPIEITYIPPEPLAIAEPAKPIAKPVVRVPEHAHVAPKAAPIVPREAAPSNHKGPPKTVIKADNDPILATEINALFGTEFPKTANRGDLYLRVDYLPTRLYRYNNGNWMEIEKSTTDTYSYNEEYIKYLIEQLSLGTYDPEILTASEKEQIEEYISKNAQSSNNTA